MSYLREVNDGIITGTILKTKRLCYHCNDMTMCIHVKKITLPPGIEPFPRLILYREMPDPNDYSTKPAMIAAPISEIGIGCGCYAKAHRQIAYLNAGLKERDKAAAKA